MSPRPTSLGIEILAKDYPAQGGRRPQPVLRELVLTCEAGSFTAITGPSGIGKTTLLNLVAGLDTAFAGQITLPAGTRLAYVFQEPRLLPWRTLRQNVELAVAAAGQGVEPGWLDELLAAAGLEAAADVYPTRLSLGMARRAGLVRAFAIRPSLLLMDEPFVSLDEPTAERLRRLLLDLLARRRATVLFVTHNLREAVRLADRLIVLDGIPARLAADLALELSPEQRGDRLAVELAARALESRLPAAMLQD